MDLGTLTLLSGLVGAALPPIIAVVNQPRWPSWARTLAMLVICSIAGTLTVAASGELVGLAWPTAVAACVAGAVVAYKHAWKPLATQIEQATSPEPTPPDPEAPVAVAASPLVGTRRRAES